jgi:hypothetical protein
MKNHYQKMIIKKHCPANALTFNCKIPAIDVLIDSISKQSGKFDIKYFVLYLFTPAIISG